MPNPSSSTRLGLWLPEPGDSLIKTLQKVYSIGPTDPGLNQLVSLHMALNPDIFAAHRPLEKKVIYLAEMAIDRSQTGNAPESEALSKLVSQKPALAGSKQRLEAVVPLSAVEVEAMRFVLGFNEVIGQIGTGVGIGATTAGTLAGRHLHADILDFNRWASERAHIMKTGKGKDLLHHYDARMNDVVRRIQGRLGPTQGFLFNGKSTKEALTSGVPRSLRPNPITISAAERIRNVASSAKAGGVALVFLDAALTCQKLSATAQEDKLETAYQELGGFVGTLATGFGVSIFIKAISTPIGWAGAIILSTATANPGKQVGSSAFNSLFESNGDVFDLKDGRLLNRWCN